MIINVNDNIEKYATETYAQEGRSESKEKRKTKDWEKQNKKREGGGISFHLGDLSHTLQMKKKNEREGEINKINKINK